MNQEEIAAKIRSDIEKTGLSVIATVDVDEVPYAYTVGLSLKGLPDLCMRGFNPKLMHTLLNDAARQLLNGDLTLSGDQPHLVSRLIKDYEAQAIPLKVEEAEFPDDPQALPAPIFTICFQFGSNPQIWQVILPTVDGSFDNPEFRSIQNFRNQSEDQRN